MRATEGECASYTTRVFSTKQTKKYYPNPDATRATHIVSKGQTWQGIAKHWKVPVETLVGFNIPGSVDPRGKIVPRAVNHFLINTLGCIRGPDGANAIFKGGEKIHIPAAGIIPCHPTFVEPADGGTQNGICWAGPVMMGGKTAVAAQPKEGGLPSDRTLYSGSFKDDKGQEIAYYVSRDNPKVVRMVSPGAGTTKVIILNDPALAPPDPSREPEFRQAWLEPGKPLRSGFTYTAGAIWAQVAARAHLTMDEWIFLWVNHDETKNQQVLDRATERYLNAKFPQGDNAVTGVRG